MTLGAPFHSVADFGRLEANMDGFSQQRKVTNKLPIFFVTT
jgi:hypothetical protein